MDIPQKNRTIVFVSLVAIVMGVIVMCGWLYNLSTAKNLFFDTPMRFNAALCFVFFGSALLVSQIHNKGCKSPIFFLLSLLGTVIGLITISQDIFHTNTGIDQLFVFDDTRASNHIPQPGRMAMNASFSFCLLGIGFLFLYLKKPLYNSISQYLFHLVTLVSVVSVIGFVYNVSLYNSLFYITSMALPTAILFIILSLGASLLNPSLGLAALFTGRRVGNQMARRLGSLIVLMIIAFGSLKNATVNSKLFSTVDIGTSLLAVCFLLASLLVIWHTANWLNKIDTQRKLAEDKVITMNAELEKRVQERTAEYKKSEERYHSLIEQATDAIYVVDNDRHFTEVNISMCDMTGYSKEELLQMTVYDVLDPEELKNDPLPHLSTYIGKPSVTRKFIRKSGELFTAEVNVKVFPDNRIMVIARDVTYRDKIANEAKEAELKFRTLADKSMVGIYTVQYGKFNYVNPRFAEIFGYEPIELTNTVPLDHIIYDTHRAYTNEQVKLRIEGKVDSVHYETKGKKKDGSGNWVEFYGSRATIGGIPTIIGSMIDVTERKKAEEELRSSELKYKLLFDSNPMPMWMIAKDDFAVIAANDAAAKHYGYTKEELLNLDTRALRLAEDYDIQAEGYLDIDKTKTVRHLRKDGTIMFVQITSHDITFEGRPVRLSLTTDVTEQLKAEESLLKSEANLQAILNTTDTAYALFDKDLKTLAFNPKATRFIKEQYGQLPESNRQLSDYFPQDRFPQLFKFTDKVLKGENINFEVNFSQADGSTLWYYVRLFPINNDGKGILGILMALYDITERKMAEQNLKTAYKHIQNHVNSIKDMAWKQSHLIRSPLANLKGLTEMLKRDPDPEILQHIQTELDRMDAIIHEMADDANTND
jgi:two-component system, sporulation sensor kinase E